ncbi:hypothetical protein [Algibacter aquimarinus]|uniref:Tim44-like domain-containing protein n=1 Tax=Algibacter aquimarinus TaxID=1136748 RepID=A0ABP9H6L6_9FLAO
MKINKLTLVITLVFVLFLFIDPVYAGPGGTVAKALFKTWWGKLLMSVLVIIFLPVVFYVRIIEFIAVRKAKKQLARLALKNKDFSWLNIQKNVSNVFSRVYLAWGNENMKEVSEYVNHWYWQNQQLVHLDRWKKENLLNVCKLQNISSIKPMYLEISDNDNFEGSKIAFEITANIEDYLIKRDTRRVVQGKKGFSDESKIWIMEYTDGKWLLDDIRDEEFSLSFAKMENVVPALDNVNRVA